LGDFLSVVAISPPPVNEGWSTLSFVSTLYLHPVLDLLMSKVPRYWQAELRLGLQEALVNAAKHGNQLDPTKQVSVKYTTRGASFWWVVTDQGSGFTPPCSCHDLFKQDCLSHGNDCGRGLYILYQIFDEVTWHHGGREVHLCKVIRRRRRSPLIL
jgi:serine/threonine-protein kinase RsbW